MKKRGVAPRPLAERFWPKVEKTDGCWIWTGARHEGGYGVIGKGGKSAGLIRAHRAAWELTNGPIPDGLYACHRCDNRACVRPDHLFLGTAKENSQDMVRKGRVASGDRSGPRNHRASYVGERASQSKLTWAQVDEIRARLKMGEKQRDLSKAFGVAQGQISAIGSGKRWDPAFRPAN